MNLITEDFARQQSLHFPLAVIMLDQAVRLAQAGFAIHWLHPKSKRPIGDDWSTKPVASADVLRATYRPGNNVGLRLGTWSKVGELFLHVIDLDIRDPDAADAARAVLDELLPEIHALSVPTVQSGSGGASRHFYILSDIAFPSKKLAHSEGFSMVWDESKKRDVKKWDWEFELFGTGKQVAIPPSTHPDSGKPYTWLRPFDFDMLDMGFGPVIDSKRLSDLLNYEPEVEINPERAKPLGITLEEAKGVLADIPSEQYREDRDGWLNVGMALHHEFAGSKEAFDVWCDYSSESEKFDRKDQWRVWKSFKPKPRMLRMATLMSAAKDVRIMRAFDEMEEDDDLLGEVGNADPMSDDDLLGDGTVSKRQQKLNKAAVEHELGFVPPQIKKLNRKHALTIVSGKTVVLHFNHDRTISYGTPSDLHAFYENNRVAIDGRTEPVTKFWMRHKERREYPNGIVFSPNEDVPGAYNHWQGFSVEPDANASCRLFLKHLRMVICKDNTESYHYLIGWLAHMIQQPEKKPGVAVVFRGKKGTGKDTVGTYVGGLFPHHHIQIANQDQLTGKFNQHQEKCLLLHVEEGFWAGNKQAEGGLKHLITSERVLIEPKGVNAFQVKSVLRLMITSNEKWVVPATADERRYFVVDVSESHKDDHRYFAALHQEAANGGRAALLHYLQNYDLTHFNVRAVPATEALAEQKIQGLQNFDRWWCESLESGHLHLGGYSADAADEAWNIGPVEIDCEEFRDVYSRWMRGRRYDGAPLSGVALGKSLKTMLPNMQKTRPRVSGRPTLHYQLPDLQTCREAFEVFLGSELHWADIPLSSKSHLDDLLE